MVKYSFSHVYLLGKQNIAGTQAAAAVNLDHGGYLRELIFLDG